MPIDNGWHMQPRDPLEQLLPLLQFLFSKNRDAPLGVLALTGIVAPGQQHTTHFPPQIFGSWIYEAQLTEFFELVESPVTSIKSKVRAKRSMWKPKWLLYLSLVRTVFNFISAMRAVHLPHGAWSLYVGLCPTTLFLQCVLVSNHANRIAAEKQYRAQQLTTAAPKDDSNPDALLSMSGLEQSLGTWIAAQFPSHSIVVCSSDAMLDAQKFPPERFEATCDQVDLCNVAEPITDPTCLFSERHVERVRFVVTQMLAKRFPDQTIPPNQSVFLGIAFLQGKRSGDRVLGTHWVIRVELTLWTGGGPQAPLAPRGPE
jgi:hypothetical protein